MPELKFEKTGVDQETGETLFRMVVNGRVVREELTIDQAVEAINAQDEERLGEDHGPRRRETDSHASAAAPARNDERRRRRAEWGT